MADTKKARSFPRRHASFAPSNRGTPVLLRLHTLHTQSRQQQMTTCPGCAAAGLNPHVNSECVPCSQWLSSAATGLQPAGGRRERSGRDRPASARHPSSFQTYPKSQNPLVIYCHLCENLSGILPLFNDNVRAAGIVVIIS